MYLNYNGIEIECVHCGASRRNLPHNEAMRTVEFATLWANGYGCAVRIFCRKCGWWHDWRVINGKTPELRRQFDENHREVVKS